MKIEPKTVIEPDLQVSSARFSPCGEFLVAPGFDAAVHRWGLGAEEPVALPPVAGHQGWATEIVFHPEDGFAITSDSWGQLRAWSYAEEKPEILWTVAEAHDGWIRALALSPDGATLATSGRDRRVRLFQAATGEPLRDLEGHTEDVFSLAFHPSGETLVSGDLRGKVIEWETASTKEIRRFEAPNLYLYERIQDVGGVRRLGWTPDGKALAAAGAKPGSGGFVKGHALLYLFDSSTGKPSHEMLLGKADSDVFAHDFFFHPTGALVAVTSGQPGKGSLIVQRPGEPEADLIHTTNLTNCHSVSLHPDGSTIAVTSTNKGSNGNGRRLVDGEYQGNRSPIHLFALLETG